MHSLTYWVLTLLATQLALRGHASIYPTHTYTLPSTIQSGASSMQTNSRQGPLDAPKLDFVNATSFEWWYFDVASYDSKASIVVVFSSEAVSLAGTPVPSGEINGASISGSFPNGTLFSIDVPAGDATVTTVGEGSSGNWSGSGMGWVGTPDLSSWTVTFNVPNSVSRAKLISPAHYGSAPASVLGVSEEVQPHFGWANAVPDAHARVKATIRGVPLIFSGSGYHDQNWGTRALPTVAKSWVWGHASVGPFSLVFWQIINTAGAQTNNFYLTRGREILALGASTLKLDSDYSFSLSLDTGYSGRYHFSGVPSVTTSNHTGYNRWVGTISGGLEDGKVEGPGPVLWEHLAL
ncbi:hypothetical protein BS47DRAFT_1337549 [Hydnum rufescens UP504]|uniref:Hydroxyneurosporene synthase n=1 Tax=Hydnum rufescens UP504 TaxID=1448309 RepID=A0A9P6E1S0_9AGAM|nr:hypothetical protein BS47DRAFT_1337549 [Hydnum rufescens UP504]